MIIYTVHEPQRPAESIEARAEGVVFVKEGFTLWGFIFGPLWLLYNRLWFEFIGALVLSGTLAAVLIEFGLKQQAAASSTFCSRSSSASRATTSTLELAAQGLRFPRLRRRPNPPRMRAALLRRLDRPCERRRRGDPGDGFEERGLAHAAYGRQLAGSGGLNRCPSPSSTTSPAICTRPRRRSSARRARAAFPMRIVVTADPEIVRARIASCCRASAPSGIAIAA